jgi:hypothetical protein
MTSLQLWAIAMAILSVNCKSETERVAFKVLAVIFLLIPFFVSVANR